MLIPYTTEQRILYYVGTVDNAESVAVVIS
jgi:hypothetical protein